MKVLFIGGTGFISTAVSRLAIQAGIQLTHLNRGVRGSLPGVEHLQADAHDIHAARAALAGRRFDAVVDWIAFTPDDIRRDLELFGGQTGQFVFISSASAYQKPPTDYILTESTPLHNPYWQYARDKIACEDLLTRAYRDDGFPVTIVRPSLTYDPNLPVALGGWGSFTLADRMLKGLPVIVHGDGTSLWVVTHAEDFGRGFIGLLGHPGALGQAFHITSDEVLNWNQIYETLAAALGVQPNLVHVASETIARIVPRHSGTLLGDKAWSAVFDNSKIKRFVPGFQAQIPLRAGLRRTLDWFGAEESRRRIDAAVNAEIETILRAVAA